MAFLYKIFRNKLVPPTDPSTSFDHKTILITGASPSGLGFAAAEKFALKGAARLILAVRDQRKGSQAKTAIEQTLRARGGKQQCSIEVWPLDMGDYGSIRAFAERASTELQRLDVAVLNAGVHHTSYTRGRYGWEADLQVNALSTTLLALLLLPKLRETGKLSGETPTLEVVSSGLHYVTKLSEEQKANDDVNLLEEFNRPEGFVANRQYGRSKLMLMYAVDALTELATGDGGGEPDVFVTAVCPGMVRTELARDYNSLLYRIAMAIASFLILRTPEQGARTYVSGVGLGLAGHGRFWQHDIIRERAPLLSGEDGRRLQQKAWHEIVTALSKDVPDVSNLVKSHL